MSLGMSRIFNFEYLPNSIKALIWNFIEKPELQTLRLVSKLWKRQIETHFGISIIVSQESWPYWRRQEEKYGVVEVTFHSLTSRFCPSVFPDQLRSIIFDRILLKNNLIIILQQFSGIENLSFSRVILDQESEITSPYPIVLPKLKTLQIEAALNEDGQLSVHDGLILSFMGQVIYGALENFCFWCSNHLIPDFHLNVLFNGSFGETDWLVEIIERNRHSIQTVLLGSPNSPFRFQFRERFQDEVNDRSPLQLEEIEADDTFPKSWDAAIRNQHYLGSIQLNQEAYQHWDATYNAIRQSSETIEFVSVSGGGGPYQIVNLDCFLNCRILRGLQLHFEVYQLDNIESLPASLHVLSLQGPLSKSEISNLTTQLVNLRVFNLDNKETSEEADNLDITDASGDQLFLGATIDVGLFRELVLMPKLELLNLWNCVMIFNGIRVWCQTQSYLECEMKARMKPLNKNSTLGNIQAEIVAGSKRRVR